MNNLSIKQILRQKNIPEEIGMEIIQYLPFPGQEKKKKELIKKMNIWCHNYWIGDCWTPPKCRPPRVSFYKYLK